MRKKKMKNGKNLSYVMLHCHIPSFHDDETAKQRYSARTLTF